MRRGATALVAAAVAAALHGVTTSARAQNLGRDSPRDPTRVVIRRAQIESAGWFALGEVLTGATGWQRATLDDVSFLASADGLQPGARAPGVPEWVVLVDGQRLAVDLLGAKLLELMPISPAQVESVTVTRVPRLVAGTVAAHGVVEFHTRRARRGPAIDGAWHSGNVTGDPGPYQFTPLAEENVDRLGPYNYAVGAFGGAGWDVGVGARQGSSHITHRGLRERFDPALYEQLGVHKWAPYDVVHARAGGTLLGGRHDVIAGRGWVNGPLFLPRAGGEQWMRATYEQIGGAGTIAAGAATVAYQATHSRLDVRELASPFAFIAGHSRRRTGGLFQVGVAGGPGSGAHFGVGVARWEMDRAGASAARSDATFYGSVAGATTRSVSQLSGSLGRSSGGPVTAKAVLSTHLALDSATRVSAAVSFAQFAAGEDGTWIDRVLLGLDTLGRDRSRNAWADVAASRRLPGGLIGELAGRLGMLNGVSLLAPSGQPVGPAVDASVAELRAGLALPLTPRVPVARVAYRYHTTISGDEAVRQALRATPTHVLEASLVGVPARDLRFGAFLDLASRARWAALRGGPASPVTLVAISRIDLSAEKWFWRRRIRTQFLLRNLLDRPERTHPLGAILPLRAHLTFELALPGM